MENPYQNPTINVSEPHKAHHHDVPYIKSWLLFFLLASVGGGLVGMLIGAIVGAALGASGMSVVQIGLITTAMGFIVGIPISFFSFKWSVSKYIIVPMQNRAS